MNSQEILDYLLKFRSRVVTEHHFLKAKVESKDWFAFESSKWFNDVKNELDAMVNESFNSNMAFHDLTVKYPDYADHINNLIYYNDCVHGVYHIFENTEDSNCFNEDELKQYKEAIDEYIASRNDAMTSVTKLISLFE